MRSFLGFISRKHFVAVFKFSERCGMSHFTQMRNCHSRTWAALGGLLGRLLLLHWQPLSFHLWDEALPGLDLLRTDSLLIGDEGLDVLEEDIDLCSLLPPMPLKHIGAPALIWPRCRRTTERKPESIIRPKMGFNSCLSADNYKSHVQWRVSLGPHIELHCYHRQKWEWCRRAPGSGCGYRGWGPAWGRGGCQGEAREHDARCPASSGVSSDVSHVTAAGSPPHLSQTHPNKEKQPANKQAPCGFYCPTQTGCYLRTLPALSIIKPRLNLKCFYRELVMAFNC